MRVLLIGWDAADWKVIRPLLTAGQMPNLARLMAQGVHGNLATIYPVLSPMLWTSISTGKRAYKHGIHGFSEPLPDGSGVRPITLLARKTKAIWNILNQTGRRCLVVGWWPSHPAEPLNGVMVSNFFQHPSGTPGDPTPLLAGTIHPPSRARDLADLRVNPMELNGEVLRLFVPEYERVDQDKDKRLHTLAKIIAETMSIHAASTELLENEAWDFAAIYYSGIDHFGHAFMRYHPPRLPQVSEEDFAVYQHVVNNAYRYHDAMLGTLLGLVDERTTVILMSDHGFHPDHLRPAYIPAEAAGPAVEHRHFGILCLKGPGFRTNEPLYGASLLDICPTILTLFGLPPGKDMDGKVLVTAFKEPPLIAPIESWDTVAGDAGTHRPETQLDPVASALAFKQLVDLGYVAPPGPNAQEAVEESVRELKYNLARSYRDGNHCGEAAALAEELWTRNPREHRFGILLVDCLAALGQVSKRRAAIEELGRRLEKYQGEARAELAKIQEETTPEPVTEQPNAPWPDAAKKREEFRKRQLRELAYGRPLLMEWLLASQCLQEKNPAMARRYLEILMQSDLRSDALNQRIAGALAELGEMEQARALLEEVLRSDPEDAVVHSQLAAIHFQAGRFEETIASATESLSLLYFQPGLHALLGRALLETKQFREAEQELLVAVAQTPRNLAAHETLGRLYRDHLDQPAEAFAHEGRALSLRNELASRQREGSLPRPKPDAPQIRTLDLLESKEAPFGPAVDHNLVITIVSGLPRSGTSMMMQLLVASGRTVLSDAERPADPDNPLGYFEFKKTLNLPKDNSWLPEARGKAVKIVAQLLPFLSTDEHYQILFMERDLAEVIASQKTMLTRQNRRGGDLSDDQLLRTFTEQVQRVGAYIAERSNIRLLRVNYHELLTSPSVGVDRIADFLGKPFEKEAALAAIRPQLRRQRA